jgi:hypothetical protein
MLVDAVAFTPARIHQMAWSFVLSLPAPSGRRIAFHSKVSQACIASNYTSSFAKSPYHSSHRSSHSKWRGSGLFALHFVESFFYLNGYLQHPTYNQFAQASQEQALFVLPGKENQSKRLFIYTTLLQQMTEKQKFHVAAKLCRDVLGGVVDGQLSMDNASVEDLLIDALDLLVCKDIKLSILTGKPDVEDEENEDPNATGTAFFIIGCSCCCQEQDLLEFSILTTARRYSIFNKMH